MAKYYTEGIVKCLEIENKQTRIKIDPCPPYKFAEKINGKENFRILCLINDPAARKTIAILSETKAKPGILVNFGDVEDGKIEKGTSFALSCATKRGHRVLRCKAFKTSARRSRSRSFWIPTSRSKHQKTFLTSSISLRFLA